VAAIPALVQNVAARERSTDVLVNTAGGPPAGRFLEIEYTVWQTAFEQNMLSSERAARAAVRYIQDKTNGGRIVDITSCPIKQAIENLILSNTMRPRVLGLTKSMAQEFAADQILVNTVGPGKIATDRITQLMEATAKKKGEHIEDVQRAQMAEIPMGRLGKPEEFAKAVLFLGSFANTYITGQGLVVDGASVQAL